MKTEVVMKRKILGDIISQKSKSGFFSATELFRVGNKWRVMNNMEPVFSKNYFDTSSTKTFMKTLSEKYGKVKTLGKGKKGGIIWVHPILFLDIALWINPHLKMEVYEWLIDNLLLFRNESGDSYKKMTGSLYLHAKNKANFTKNIQIVAQRIKKECGVADWNEANEEQLKLRDKMHDYISFACDIVKNSNTAIELGIKKAKRGEND